MKLKEFVKNKLRHIKCDFCSNKIRDEELFATVRVQRANFGSPMPLNKHPESEICCFECYKRLCLIFKGKVEFKRIK